VPPEAFREVMGFLLGFIKKEKQVDGLLEKLCARVIAATDQPQQRRDMAYCLGQLQVCYYVAVIDDHDDIYYHLREQQ
jgi:hypothetical protein